MAAVDGGRSSRPSIDSIARLTRTSILGGGGTARASIDSINGQGQRRSVSPRKSTAFNDEVHPRRHRDRYRLVKYVAMQWKPTALCAVGELMWVATANGLIFRRELQTGKLVGKISPVPEAVFKSNVGITTMAFTGTMVDLREGSAREKRLLMMKNGMACPIVWIAMSNGELSAWDFTGTRRVVFAGRDRYPIISIVPCPSALWTLDTDGTITQRSLLGEVRVRLSLDVCARSITLAGNEIFAGTDRGVWVFDCETADTLNAISVPRKGALSRLPVRSIVAANSNTVWSGNADGSICIWDAKTKKLLNILDVHCHPIAYIARVGRHMWSVDTTGDVHCWTADDRSSRGFIELNYLQHFHRREGMIVAVGAVTGGYGWVLYSSPPALELYEPITRTAVEDAATDVQAAEAAKKAASTQKLRKVARPMSMSMPAEIPTMEEETHGTSAAPIAARPESDRHIAMLTAKLQQMHEAMRMNTLEPELELSRAQLAHKDSTMEEQRLEHLSECRALQEEIEQEKLVALEAQCRENLLAARSMLLEKEVNELRQLLNRQPLEPNIGGERTVEAQLKSLNHEFGRDSNDSGRDSTASKRSVSMPPTRRSSTSRHLKQNSRAFTKDAELPDLVEESPRKADSPTATDPIIELQLKLLWEQQQRKHAEDELNAARASLNSQLPFTRSLDPAKDKEFDKAAAAAASQTTIKDTKVMSTSVAADSEQLAALTLQNEEAQSAHSQEIFKQRQFTEQVLLTLREERHRWVSKARMLSVQLARQETNCEQEIDTLQRRVTLLQQQLGDAQREHEQANQLLKMALAVLPIDGADRKSVDFDAVETSDTFDTRY